MKRILIILFFLFGLFKNLVLAQDSIPIENVFKDISKNYKYYNEMQYLYDKGIIEPEQDNKWHPNKLLERDEFVGIATETSCNRCIVPKEEKILHKYDNKKPFFDVGLDNKNYYCIAKAAEDQFVVGYEKNTKCNDGTWQKGKSPFCTKNNIKLEEALAVVMRMGKILSHKQAQEVINNIKENPNNYKDLSKDVKVFIEKNRVYSFYPYFKKALEFEIDRYDNLGNRKTYKFIEKKDYIHPKKYITKEEFLKMAYIALKANSCNYEDDNKLALKIHIYDKGCDKNLYKLNKCIHSNKNGKIFDFAGEVKGICERGIDDIKGYTWKFFNIDTGETIIKYGEFIDNYKFLKEGRYRIILETIDKCGNTARAIASIYIKGNNNINNDLLLYIKANPIIGPGPLEVDLEGVVIGNTGPYKYFWNFGDGEKGNTKKLKHIFIIKGYYNVKLLVIDKNGQTARASVSIKVLDNECKNDTDKDGIDDCSDQCIFIPGEKENSGCPIFIKKPKNKIDLSDCEYSLKRTGYIYGNIKCDTCPCKYFIDFKSSLRACDIVIPIITNNIESKILQKGNNFTIGDIF